MTTGEGPAAGDRSPGSRAREDGRLADGVTGLASLESGVMPLRELLTRVARYAVHSIPGADGAGLTLIEQDRSDTIVATAAFVVAVDDIQYGLGDGPCIMAAREGRTVISGALEDEPRWGTFGRQVAAMGVHSVVSLPLRLGIEVIGAMNVYAHAHDAFDARAAELGEAFAIPAAVAVQHAHVLERTRRVAEHLRVSLQARMVVEQAVGVLMGRHDLEVGPARRRLAALAEERDEPVAVVAEGLVAEASRRTDGRGPAEE